MAHLRLYFVDRSQPELVETEYRDERVSEGALHCVRSGKTPGSSGIGAFRWTNALKALSVLVVNTAASKDCSYPYIYIDDQEGGLASSLDYALSKKPLWLMDMFGLQEEGLPTSNLLFKRVNPERKRKGPVQIAINSDELRRESIEVFMDGVLVESKDELSNIARMMSGEEQNTSEKGKTAASIESDLSTTQIQSGTEKPIKLPGLGDDASSWLKNLYTAEVHSALIGTDIFSKSSIKRLEDRALNDSFCNDLSSTNQWVKLDFEEDFSVAELHGMHDDKHFLDRYLADDKPLTIAVPNTDTPALAIMHYLKSFKDYNIELTDSLHNSIELHKSIVEGKWAKEPDACVLCLPTIATMKETDKRDDYFELILMPGTSVRAVAPGSKPKGKIIRKNLRFIDEPASRASHYVSILQSKEIVEKKRLEADGGSIAKTTRAFIEGRSDLVNIAPFPFYAIRKHYFGGTYVDTELESELQRQSSVLMLHSRHGKNPHDLAKALNIAIRNAWLSLLEDSTALEETITLVLASASVRRTLSRLSGLHHVASSHRQLINDKQVNFERSSRSRGV